MRAAKGKRGSWFASVGNGEYPVMHSHWYSPPADYHDINLTPAFCEGSNQALKFLKALQTGTLAILARSNPSNPDNTLERFVRESYIGLFEYEFVSCDEHGLRLKFVDRVESLR